LPTNRTEDSPKVMGRKCDEYMREHELVTWGLCSKMRNFAVWKLVLCFSTTIGCIVWGLQIISNVEKGLVMDDT